MIQKAICPNSGQKNAVIYALFSDWIQSGPKLDTILETMRDPLGHAIVENRPIRTNQRWDGS